MERENVPCWCEISFRENPLGIAVRIHKEIANLKENEQMITVIQEIFDFKKFSKMTDNVKFYGFDHAGIKKDAGEFIEIFFAIPPVEILTDEICPHCNGTGKDEYFKRICSYCEGSKKKILHDYKSISAVSSSLSVLFQCSQMYSPDEKTTSEVNQLIALDIICSDKMGGCGIGGVWSAEFCNYIRYLFYNQERKEEVIKEAVEAMKKVFFHCYYKEDKNLYKNEFWISVDRDAWLLINFFGDRCGIYPLGGSSSSEKRGREFSCHNVDNAIQQLGLLAAMCVIHDNLREDWDHY